MDNQILRPIHLDCRQYGVSGIGTYIQNLINQYQINSSDLDFHLLVRSEHKKKLSNSLEFQLSEYNETIYSIKEQLNWVTRIDPMGILHVPHYNAPLLYPGKLIITVHDVCHVAMKQYFPGLLKRMYSSLFFKRILVKADHIITVSNFSKSEIVKYFDINPEKISVIYNGVSPEFCPIPKSESGLILDRYHLPQEYLLFLGNIKPHKNIQGVLSSYQKALHEDKNLPPLVILGNNARMYEDIPEISEFLSDNLLRKNVIFTGYLPNEVLPAIYSRAILFLFPSFYEGFGLTILEAMASGTPVITSNVSAIPEVADGAAVLVNPHDQDEIAQQIINLVSDRDMQAEYINKGFEHIKKYSWQKSAKSHLDIYRKFLRQPATTPKWIRPAKAKLAKKSILFLDQYGDRIGGGQVILLDILEKFRSTGNWEVHVSVPEEGKFTNLLSEHGFQSDVIKTWQPKWQHELKFTDYIRHFFSSIRSSYYISRLIKRYKIDVVYCNGGRTFLNGTFLSLLFSLKLFFHLHLLYDDKQKRAVTMLGRSPVVKSIFAVSNLLEQQYKTNSVNKKMCVVSNWVSPELVEKTRALRDKAVRLPIRVGVVGQISKVKGQWSVLESLYVSKAVLPINLSLYGEPLLSDNENWQDVLRMIEELNTKGWDINYKGFNANKLSIYDNLDVLIIPSFVPESFGLTAIEAMSREVIVVANKSGALVEIINHQENGILYDANDNNELVHIFTNLTEGKVDFEILRRNGLQTVLTHYHPEKQLEMLHSTVLKAVS